MVELTEDKAAVKLPDKWRRRRAERIAAAETAQAKEGRLFKQTAAVAEAVKSAKVAQALKTNATRPASQGFKCAARRS